MPRALKVTTENLDAIVNYGASLLFDLSHIESDLEEATEEGHDLYAITDGYPESGNVTFTNLWGVSFKRIWKFVGAESDSEFMPIEYTETYQRENGMRHEMITHPTRDLGKEIPESLRKTGYWFIRVDQLREGDKFFRIDCDLNPCAATPCTHNPEVLTDSVYQVMRVEPWSATSPLAKVFTDYGYFVARKTDSACIIETGGEKVQSVLDNPETSFRSTATFLEPLSVEPDQRHVQNHHSDETAAMVTAATRAADAQNPPLPSFDHNADPESVAARAAELSIEQLDRLASYIKKSGLAADFYKDEFEIGISNKIGRLMSGYAVLKGLVSEDRVNRH